MLSSMSAKKGHQSRMSLIIKKGLSGYEGYGTENNYIPVYTEVCQRIKCKWKVLKIHLELQSEMSKLNSNV